MAADQKDFIKGAISHPGALRVTAKRLGLITGGEALSAQDIQTLARSKDKTTAKRARFAETLGKLRK